MKDKLLPVLAVFSIVYSAILVIIQNNIGVSYWDIFVYLDNAMLFSHINIGSQLSVPPIISLFTSIFFQMGFISELSLFIVSGILFVFLIIGIYLLFNYRFDEELSFLASIIFSMLSLVVTWAVSGSNDLPALTFAVWSIIFTIKGLDDYRYYYLTYLTFLLAFFTRFTEGFVLILIICYLLFNLDKFKLQLTRKNIIRFSIFVLITLIVIVSVYLSYMHTIPFISQFIEVSNSNQVSSVNVGYELNPWYYIQYLPNILTSLSVNDSYFHTLSTVNNNATLLSFVIMFFSLCGIVSFIFNIANEENEKVNNYKFKSLILIILSLICIFSYTHVSYMITEVLFTCIVLLLYRWLPLKVNQMDLIMILWMGIFIILHSYHPVKVDRYIVATFIPLIYFMILGIRYISKNLTKEKKKTTLIITTIILLILIPINMSYLNSLNNENPHTHEERMATQWLKDYDPNYASHNISSDRGVAMSWYLKKYTYTTIPRVLENSNESLTYKLNAINAKYYIDSSTKLIYIKGYHKIYENNNKNFTIRIYERD